MISFLYIFEYTNYGQVVNRLKYIIILVFLFFAVMDNKDNLFTLPKNKIIVGVLISFIIIPFGQSLILLSLDIGIYTMIMLIFLFGTYLIGKYVSDGEREKWFAKIFAFVGTLIILVCFLLNFQNLFNLSSILSNFSAELNITADMARRERAAFGFMHVNSLGGICLAVIASITMTFSKLDSRKEKFLKYGAIIFCFTILLNTGSRASIYGIVIYAVVNLLEKLYYRSSFVFKFIMRIVFVIIGLYLFTIILSTVTNEFEFANRLTSGRLEGWIYDFSKMKKDGVLLFGYGLYNPTSFFSQSFSNGMIVDNWYIYMIVNIGFVGFAGCILIVICMLTKLIKMCSKSNIMAQKVLALFIANLAHAMAEKAFITPADPISFFMLVMVFSTIYSPYFNRYSHHNQYDKIVALEGEIQ